MTNQYHFAVIDIKYAPTATGVTIIVTTDVPCHLWMRWTNQQPLVHQDPYYRRGIAIGTTPRFCFDIYEDNEQLETGDTYVHTFYKPAWVFCETRWFYFWGTRYGFLMPSESCIFEYHSTSTEIPVLILNHDPPTTGLYGLFTDLWYGNTFKPPYDFKLTNIEVRYNRMAPAPCANGILHLYNAPTIGNVLPVLIETSVKSLPSLPWTPDSIFINFFFSENLVLKDQIYMFLSAGCSPYYTAPFHMTPKTNQEGYRAGCKRWHWYPAGDPPFLNWYPDESQNHKIWGIPV